VPDLFEPDPHAPREVAATSASAPALTALLFRTFSDLLIAFWSLSIDEV
jgi:hypothetical protein